MQAATTINATMMQPTTTPIDNDELVVCPLDALFIEETPLTVVGFSVAVDNNACVGMSVGGGVGLKLGVIVG